MEQLELRLVEQLGLGLGLVEQLGLELGFVMQLDDLRRVVERDIVRLGHSTPHLVVETPHR